MTEFVLVPGAWLGAWAWKKVIPPLEEAGHTAYPVTLTGMGERVHLSSADVGMETLTQDVLNVIKYNDLDGFILVGHSFAGKVAAAVADRVPEKVKLLIYLDAFRPAKVRTPQGAFDPTSEFGPTLPGTDAIPFTEKVVDAIGSDVRGADRDWMLSRATPWPQRPAKEPLALSERFDSVKSAYIFCTKSGDPVDEIVAGKWGKLEGPYRIMDTGHWPMVTKPGELAENLISLATDG